MQSTSYHPIPPRLVLTLSSYLHVGLPRGLFPVGFPTKILYEFLISLVPATCYGHLILLDLITLIVFSEGNKL
jgi:hypothetical protein